MPLSLSRGVLCFRFAPAGRLLLGIKKAAAPELPTGGRCLELPTARRRRRPCGGPSAAAPAANWLQISLSLIRVQSSSKNYVLVSAYNSLKSKPNFEVKFLLLCCMMIR